MLAGGLLLVVLSSAARPRDVAEAGARVSLEVLAVQHHEPYGHMGAEQRTLRRRLRAHARQLGDRPDARSGGHGIDHLVRECAYEHWHGMLFARFLAENQLLIEPQMGVAITLDECEELAKDEGVDQWMLAARFVHCMLPQVFRPDHPMFEVQFAREHRPEARRAGGRRPGGGVRGDRFARLSLPVLADEEEGRGQRRRQQDRRE